MKNVFYCSNAHEELFNNNTRSSFNSYIDIHDLDYLHDDVIEAAIKSITFDDKTTVKIKKNYAKPNIVLKQILNTDMYYLIKQFYEDTDFDHEEIFSTPDLSKSMDYVVINDGFQNVSIYKDQNESKFCNLQILTPYYVMHNIYLHDIDIFSESELIFYLNNVLKSVSRSVTMRSKKIVKDLMQKGKDGITYLKHIEHDIYIDGELGNILNLDNISMKVHSGISMRDVFRWVKQKKTISTFPNNYINTLLDYKQELRYYKVGKRMKSKKLILKLFENEKLYGIKSNISDPIVRNGEYDNIVSLFVGNKTNDVVHVDFKNPSFFQTRKELLSRASFKIIDVTTNTTPYFAVGSPTYIQVVVRKKVMEKSFNIFLDSSSEKSKAIYPGNNATNFTIELPERLSFSRDWQVTLKSLFLPNNIHNVPDCYLMYSQCREGKDGEEVKVLHSKKLVLKEGNYPTIDSILNDLNEQISEAQLPISMEDQDGKVKISCDTYLQNETFLQLEMGQDLAYILGYIKPPEKFTTLRLYDYQDTIAPYEADMFRTYPKNLIIGCDVVDNTIFGGEHVKLLRMVTNTEHSSSNILSFEFLQNEYVDLNVKEFKSIKIAIMDATGNPVKTDSSTPTRLQLMFSTV